jgi:SAM-dependent methyltransferase
LHEYPIIDGIPLLVADLRSYVTNSLLSLLCRDDLSATIESLVGDCCGPGTALDAIRTHLSSYAWDHYADFDPEENRQGARPGCVVRVLDKVCALAGPLTGPVLDLGCSVGRSSLELGGRQVGLVIGVDLNLTMLRVAAGVLAHGRVRYPRKRVGLVYDRREFDVHFGSRDRIDYWACDALALPFAPGTFGAVVALNLLDCVASPRDALAGIRRVLRPGGVALLTTPYDWSPAATPVEAWIGGHSQRGQSQGASEPLLRTLLTPGAHPQSIDGMEIVGESLALPWHLRVHERSMMEYAVHALAARVKESPS